MALDLLHNPVMGRFHGQNVLPRHLHEVRQSVILTDERKPDSRRPTAFGSLGRGAVRPSCEEGLRESRPESNQLR
jgi:hypothetical protein